jgi:hypothetical protein
MSGLAAYCLKKKKPSNQIKKRPNPQENELSQSQVIQCKPNVDYALRYNLVSVNSI